MKYIKLIIFGLFTYKIIDSLDFIITLPFLENFDHDTITFFSTALFSGIFWHYLDDKEQEKMQIEWEKEEKKREQELAAQKKRDAKRRAQRKKRDAKHRAQRKKKLIEKYGEEFGSLIASKQIGIGMTKEMLLEALGKAADIKETVSKNSIKEKHYYFPRETRQKTTVYKLQVNIEDGLIDSWRDL